MDEVGIDEATGKVRIQVDPKYYRPTEVVSLTALHNLWLIIFTILHNLFKLTLWGLLILEVLLLSRIFYKEMQLRFIKL